MRTSTLVTALFCISISAATQSPLIYSWDRGYGGQESEFLSMLLPLNDGGFIAAGTCYSPAGFEVTQNNFDSSNSTADAWLIKNDSDGNPVWDVRLGGTGNEWMANLSEAGNGDILVVIGTMSPLSGNISQAAFGSWDIWVVRLNSNGSMIWNKRFGGNDYDMPTAIYESPNGEIFVSGSTGSPVSGTVTQTSDGATDMYLIRMDSSGNQLWDRRYGGTADEFARNVVPTGGGFFLAGTSLSGIGGDKTVANYEATESDMWVVKIDNDGNFLWDKVIGSLDNDQVVGCAGYVDGGLILGTYVWADIGGDKSEPTWGALDAWYVRMDPNGNILWDHSIGGEVHEDDYGNIFVMSDNNILLSGTSYSGIYGWKTETNVGPENDWLVLVDPNGEKLWDKTILTGFAHSEFCYAVELADGCIIAGDQGDALVGNDKTDQTLGFDYWIVKYCIDEIVIEPPVAEFTSTSESLCGYATLNLDNTTTGIVTTWNWNISGPDSFLFTEENPGNIEISTPGVYEIELIACNEGGCDTTSTNIEIDFTQPFVVDLGNDMSVCSDTEIVLDTGLEDLQHEWTHEGTTLSESGSQLTTTEEGTYNVSVSDNNGCTGLDEIEIMFLDSTASFTNSEMLCDGDSLLLITSFPAPVSWTYNDQLLPDTTSEFIAENEGTFIATYDSECGVSQHSFFVSAGEFPILEVQFTDSMCLDSIVVLFAQSPNGSITWSTGSAASSVVISAPGTYYVQAENSCGIRDSSINITGYNCTKDFITDGLCDVWMPNAFTPDNDGINDVVFPSYNPACIEILSFSIYDRWGMKIFESESPDKKWYGQNAKNYSQNDVYVYQVIYSRLSESPQSLTGHLTLVR